MQKTGLVKFAPFLAKDDQLGGSLSHHATVVAACRTVGMVIA